jgi:hypothetical protein
VHFRSLVLYSDDEYNNLQYLLAVMMSKVLTLYSDDEYGSLPLYSND